MQVFLLSTLVLCPGDLFLFLTDLEKKEGLFSQAFAVEF